MNKFLFVVGPTCSGKNDYAYELSKLIDIEVINADSIQVYKQLKILSNRPTEQELKIVPHHLYGHVNNKEYSVNHWIDEVKQVIKNIQSRNKIPVFVGGTGFYIQSLIEGLSVMPSISYKFKKQAEDFKKEIDALKSQLSVAAQKEMKLPKSDEDIETLLSTDNRESFIEVRDEHSDGVFDLDTCENTGTSLLHDSEITIL